MYIDGEKGYFKGEEGGGGTVCLALHLNFFGSLYLSIFML